MCNVPKRGPPSSSVKHESVANRPVAQLWPGNEVRGITGENWLRCVCFSFELSFFFCFAMSFSDHCGVHRCSNIGRADPLLFSHSFPRSSELKKRWFLAIRDAYAD